MTHKEAVQEAQKRWGEFGRAFKIRGKNTYQVGRILLTGRGYRQTKFVRYAIGGSYEEAFRNADETNCSLSFA
jgi:hypothetical protein